MIDLESDLSTFLIHYSPLKARLDRQKAAKIWNLLNPTLVTEKSIKGSRANKIFEDLSVNVRVEIMAQVLEIIPILRHHTSLINSQSASITPYSLTKNAIGLRYDAQVAYPFYRDALNAYSKKNHELTCQHLTAIKMFLESNRKYCLILEDDSLAIDEDIVEVEMKLKDCLNEIKEEELGYYDISDSLSFRPYADNLKDEISVFTKMGYGQTRCASAYVITRSTACVLGNELYRSLLPIDWHHSYVLKTIECPTYWSRKGIFTQGSQSGHFVSNQINRNSDDD